MAQADAIKEAIDKLDSILTTIDPEEHSVAVGAILERSLRNIELVMEQLESAVERLEVTEEA